MKSILSRAAVAALGTVLMLACGPHTAGAQPAGGTSALPFFLEPPDAARASLGGPQSARGGDVAALFVNPAGACGLALEGFVTHAELGQGLRLESAALAMPVGRAGGTLSVGFAYAHVALEGRDENGDPSGSAGYSAGMLRAGYARNFGPVISAGLALEYLYQGIAGETGSGWAMAVGALARTKTADFSLVADHVGPDLSSSAGTAPAPRTLRAGVRLHPAGAFDLLAELSRTGEARPFGAAGVEYRPAPAVALRLGYRRDLSGTDPLSGFSAGVGFGTGRWIADYGLVQDGGQSPVHRLSLRIGLGLPRLAP
ncbi:MAG: hypothetical protein HZB25_05340 [Candidatus Eisenbacteria bacterium]|nr:hypothetical protein [Candidatus Eisenbacteria bacterium]